eukprot:gene8273-14229_t
MVTCQYFLQGTCKFGVRCRNEHPTGGLRTSNSFGGLNKSSFGSAAGNVFSKEQAATNNQNPVDKIVSNIKSEILLWEKSKMWLFSCFSYQKESPCVSGLVDKSPDEMRLDAYIAKEKGTTSEYLNNMKQLNLKFMTRRAELKSITVANWEQVLQNSPSNISSSSALFSGSSTLFSSQPSQAANPFASSTAKQSLFGSSTSQSLLSAASPFHSKQDSTFGSGQSSLFGTSKQSIFSSNANAGNSLFSSNTNAQPGLFQQKQQQPFISSSNPMQASSVGGLFTQQTPLGSGLSSQQPSNSGLFTEKNLFSGNNPQSSNLFGQKTSNQAINTATGPAAGFTGMQVSPSVLKQQVICGLS